MARRLQYFDLDYRQRLSQAMKESWRRRGHVVDSEYLIVRLSNEEARHIVKVIQDYRGFQECDLCHVLVNRISKAKRYPPKKFQPTRTT